MDAVAALAAIVADSVDLDAVVRLAHTAGPLPENQDPSPERGRPSLPRPRIAVAAGPAFTFGYAEHPELLAAAGAEVVTFDPLRDERLPGDVDGLVIGGGFPEEHAAGAAAPAWHWQRPGGAVTEGFVRGGVHASYLHTHWNGVPGAAMRITAAARQYQQGRSDNSGGGVTG